VTFDARGNGESDKPTEPQDYALELMVDDVLAVADACDAASFHYLGFSLGAKVGWGVAAWAQDRLESIALIGAEPEANEAISEEFTALLRQGMDAVAAAMSRCGRCRTGHWTSNAETTPKPSWPTSRPCGPICRRYLPNCACHRY
jgi:pimeloyl-ACP methyl ester carboxylesterase